MDMQTLRQLLGLGGVREALPDQPTAQERAMALREQIRRQRIGDRALPGAQNPAWPLPLPTALGIQPAPLPAMPSLTPPGGMPPATGGPPQPGATPSVLETGAQPADDRALWRGGSGGLPTLSTLGNTGVTARPGPWITPHPLPEGYKPGPIASIMRGEFPMSPGRGIVGSALQHLMPTEPGQPAASPIASSPLDTGEAQGLPPARSTSPSPYIDLEAQRGRAMPAGAMPPTARPGNDVGGPPGDVASPAVAARLNALAGRRRSPVGSPGAMPAATETSAPASPGDPTGGFHPNINPEMGGGRLGEPAQTAAGEGSGGLGKSWLDRLAGGGGGADMLLQAGLATMAAGGRPGASALSSIGEGGMYAVKSAREERRLDLKDKREERQLTQGDRRLELEDKGLKIKADDFLMQLQQRALDSRLNREQRAEAQRDANELRQSIAGMAAGSRADALRVQQMTESGRREDRQAEHERRTAEDKRQLDQAATGHYERILRDYKDISGQITPDARREAEDIVLRGYPESTLGKQIGMQREIDKARGKPLPMLNGKPDPTKLAKDETYSTSRGPAKWNGSAFEPVGQQSQ